MSCAARTISLLLAPTVLSEAFRVRPQRRTQQNASLAGADGEVDALYTWGAASPFKGGWVENPKSNDGCWEGLRIVNVNTNAWGRIKEVDIVPPLLGVVGFEHAKQAVAKMDQTGKVWNYPCGKKLSNPLKGLWEIHLQDPYTERAGVLPQPAQDFTKAALWPSYYYDFKEIADYIKPFGLKLVGSSKENEKVVHLLQDSSTLECLITFQGSAQPDDWWGNLQFGDSPYCGLSRKVHHGFREQLRWTMESAEFQSNIRPKLGKCKKVIAVGHSLGGAMADMFAACVNTAPTSGDGWESDYKFIQWKKESPQRLTAIA